MPCILAVCSRANNSLPECTEVVGKNDYNNSQGFFLCVCVGV
jgi:hypothetical protein